MEKVRAHLLATAAIVALSGSAYAADMGVPTKAAAPAPIPYVGWQGFYVGGAIGTARLNGTATTTFQSNGNGSACNEGESVSACSTRANGFTAGVQAGYDWQSRYFVYGVVADWAWTGLKHTVTNNPGSVAFFTAKVDWLATFRGRMGLALDDTLLYVTGGLALGHLKSNVGFSGFFNYAQGLNTTRAGWVAGAGLEHKINQNWSFFSEFLYYDLGRASASGPGTTIEGASLGYSTEFTHEIFQVKTGLNYRF